MTPNQIVVYQPSATAKKNKQIKKAKNPKASRNGKRKGPGPSSRDYTATEAYVKSLVDPFEYSGGPLGWGTMLPTTVQQAYRRGIATANADGSLVLVCNPSATSTLAFWTGGAAIAGPGGVANAMDLAAITANYTDARVISFGIRSYPIIAATSVPGVVYSGALPCPVWTDLVAGGTLTPNDFAAFPTSHMSIGRDGACATGRPADPTSFEFEPWVVSGFSANYQDPSDDIPFSVPYNAYISLPASALVAYEVCVNFEGIAKVATGTSAMGLGQGTASTSTTLADVWGTVERMWGSLKTILPPPGREGSGTASTDAGGTLVRSSGGSTTIGKLLGYGQTAMKYGSLLRQVLR